jgi:hypothetical protein
LLGHDTRYFDYLIGYFFISGFYKLYPALWSWRTPIEASRHNRTGREQADSEP